MLGLFTVLFSLSLSLFSSSSFFLNPFRILEVMDLICWCTCRNSNIVTGLHFQLYRLGL